MDENKGWSELYQHIVYRMKNKNSLKFHNTILKSDAYLAFIKGVTSYSQIWSWLK